MQSTSRPPKVSNRNQPKDLTTKHLAVVMQNSVNGSSRGPDLMQSSLPVDTQATQRIKDSGVTHQDKSLFDVSVSPDWRHIVYQAHKEEFTQRQLLTRNRFQLNDEVQEPEPDPLNPISQKDELFSETLKSMKSPVKPTQGDLGTSSFESSDFSESSECADVKVAQRIHKTPKQIFSPSDLSLLELSPTQAGCKSPSFQLILAVDGRANYIETQVIPNLFHRICTKLEAHQAKLAQEDPQHYLETEAAQYVVKQRAPFQITVTKMEDSVTDQQVTQYFTESEIKETEVSPDPQLYPLLTEFHLKPKTTVKQQKNVSFPVNLILIGRSSAQLDNITEENPDNPSPSVMSLSQQCFDGISPLRKLLAVSNHTTLLVKASTHIRESRAQPLPIGSNNSLPYIEEATHSLKVSVSPSKDPSYRSHQSHQSHLSRKSISQPSHLSHNFKKSQKSFQEEYSIRKKGQRLNQAGVIVNSSPAQRDMIQKAIVKQVTKKAGIYVTSIDVGANAFSRMTKVTSVMVSKQQRDATPTNVVKEQRKVESDVETNLWRYSPLISSASEDDFKEALKSEGSLIKEAVTQVNKRKRNNRVTYSAMNVKRLKRSNASVCSRHKKRKVESEDSLFKRSANSSQDLMAESEDCQKIYQEVIPATEIEEIMRKYRVHRHLSSQPKEKYQWDSFTYCRSLLKSGVEIIKANFSNECNKRVRFWLSQDEQYLCYRDTEPTSKLLDCLRGDRRISFKDIRGFLFGAQSTTFQKRRKFVLKQLQFQKSMLNSEKNTKDFPRTPSRLTPKSSLFKDKLVTTKTPVRETSLKRKQSFGGRSHHSVYNPSMIANKLTQKIEEDVRMFYSWQCISLVMANFTVDLIIKEDDEMMCLIHLLVHKLGGGPSGRQEPKSPRGQEALKFDQCLRPYKFMKFRMKLSYFSWLRNMPINELLMKAIIATLTEIRKLAVYQLQQLVAKGGVQREKPDSISEESFIKTSSEEGSYSSSDSCGSGKDSDGFSLSQKSSSSSKNSNNGIMKKLKALPLKRMANILTKKKSEFMFHREKLIQNRLTAEKRQRKKVCAALKHFINMTQLQISFITLLQEDNMNPLLHIIHMFGWDNKKKTMPASTHWYMGKDQNKRIKNIDLSLDKKTRIESAGDLVLAGSRQNQTQSRRGHKLQQLETIFELQLQIVQVLTLKKRLCDIELLNIQEHEAEKRRYVAKKRRQVCRELKLFKEKAINDRKRLKFANDKQVVNHYLMLVFMFYNEVKQLNELSLLKYKNRLRQRKAEEVHFAKKRIRQLHLEMYALHTRAKRFTDLLQLSEREQEIMSISKRVIVSMRDQLRKKHETQKLGIKEITAMYGLHNTDFKHRLKKERETGLKHGLTMVEKGGLRHQITAGTAEFRSFEKIRREQTLLQSPHRQNTNGSVLSPDVSLSRIAVQNQKIVKNIAELPIRPSPFGNVNRQITFGMVKAQAVLPPNKLLAKQTKEVASPFGMIKPMLCLPVRDEELSQIQENESAASKQKSSHNMSRIQLEIQREAEMVSNHHRSEIFDFDNDNEEISLLMVSQQIRDISQRQMDGLQHYSFRATSEGSPSSFSILSQKSISESS